MGARKFKGAKPHTWAMQTGHRGPDGRNRKLEQCRGWGRTAPANSGSKPDHAVRERKLHGSTVRVFRRRLPRSSCSERRDRSIVTEYFEVPDDVRQTFGGKRGW